METVRQRVAKHFLGCAALVCERSQSGVVKCLQCRSRVKTRLALGVLVVFKPRRVLHIVQVKLTPLFGVSHHRHELVNCLVVQFLQEAWVFQVVDQLLILLIAVYHIRLGSSLQSVPAVTKVNRSRHIVFKSQIRRLRDSSL